MRSSSFKGGWIGIGRKSKKCHGGEVKIVTTASRLGKFPPEVRDYFPFEPRPGQSMMANEIYYGVLARNDVAIEGAAGMGKTITCLSALLPICKREGLTLLYAARTHTQIQRVIEELSAIYNVKEQDLTAISLYGRANMCLHDAVQELQPVEAMEMCGILRRTHGCDWYEQLKIKEIDRVSGCFTSEYIREFGMESGVCPYYLSKELLRYCRVIALTYVYLINPFMRSILFRTLQQNIENCILVFDECHNLPDLAMHAMSIGVSLRGVERAIKEYDHFDPTGQYSTISKFLKHFKVYLDKLHDEYGTPEEELEIGVEPGAVVTHFQTFMQAHGVSDLFFFARKIQEFGRRIKRSKIEEKRHAHSSIFHFGQFLEHLLTTHKDVQYLHYITISKQRIQYYIRCIDCRGILKPLQRARNIISISGTLEPIEAYLEICGFPKKTQRKILPSPFNNEKVRVLTCRGIDITFFNRTAEQYQLLAKKCLEAIQATPGNTAIFCASYDVLTGLLKTSLQQQVRQLKRPFFYEQKSLGSRENDEMIAKFKANGHNRTDSVLLGVCGGRNSEGMDFPGPEMLTVIILGIPLARMTHSTHALITYYTKQFGAWKGKEYAYTLPALRRANQAAGRPIRTLEDHGVIVLLDERYSHAYYRRYLSNYLNDNLTILPAEEGTLEREIRQFYSVQKKREE